MEQIDIREFSICIITIVIFAVGFILLVHFTEESRPKLNLTDYSCEEIKGSIDRDSCLTKIKSESGFAMFPRCFTMVEKINSYNSRCKLSDLKE